MELGLTEDGLAEIVPNVMAKSNIKTVEMEPYLRVIEREQELIERAEREPPQPKTDAERLKMGHAAIIKPFTMDLPHGDEYNYTDNLHPAMLLRAPLVNPFTLWNTLSQRFKENKCVCIKSYNMDHVNGMTTVSDRAWVAAHDYSITEFSVQHFMGPGLKALIKNQMKTAVDKIYRVEDGVAIMRMEADQFVEITRLCDFHNSFDKMCFVCRRAHPLDYSYESIRGFLSAEHHFEGIEHYQDRQGMPPAVLCVKMVDTIVYENRQAFVREGETAAFHTQAKLHEQKSRLLRLIYDNMGITPKVLKLPEPAATQAPAKAAGGGKAKQQQPQQSASSSQKREPFWKWGPMCKFYTEGTCNFKDARSCKKGKQSFVHGCTVKLPAGHLCRQHHRASQHNQQDPPAAAATNNAVAAVAAAAAAEQAT